jgi:hypothetical protein
MKPKNSSPTTKITILEDIDDEEGCRKDALEEYYEKHFTEVIPKSSLKGSLDRLSL